MNSKEALEILFSSYNFDGNYHDLIIAREKLEQSLDRLEQLEKENQVLKEKYKKRAELSKELCDGLKQYEKVLDFLIGKFKLELKEGKLYFLYNNQYFELDKENESMLKSVLGEE